MQLLIWVGICLVVSIRLRKSPRTFVALTLILVIMVPATAVSVLTGVPRSSASPINVAAGTWMLAIYSVVYLFARLPGAGRVLRGAPLILIVMLLSVSAAALFSAVNLGGSAPRAFIDIFAAPILATFLYAAGQEKEPVVSASIQIGRREFATLIHVLAFLQSLLALLQYATSSQIIYSSLFTSMDATFRDDVRRPQGTFDHTLILALFMVIAIPLTARLHRHRWRFSLAALYFLTILLTGSRASLLLGVLGLLYLSTAALRARPKAAAFTAALAVNALAGLASPVGQQALERFRSDDGSAAKRDVSYQFLQETWPQYLLFGNGYGANAHLVERGLTVASLESGYGMLAYDIGIFATLLLLGVQVFLCLSSLRQPVMRPYAVAAFLAILASASFSSFGVRSASGLLLWLAFAPLVAYRVQRSFLLSSQERDRAASVYAASRRSARQVPPA